MHHEGMMMPLPSDVRVANSFSPDAKASVKDVSEITEDEMILDIGPQTQLQYADIIRQCRTILWNGPVGVFEFEAFSSGTKCIAETIANHDCYSLAGGGDTIAAIEKFGIVDKISYISTGGGAFLSLLEQGTLDTIELLKSKENIYQ